MKKAMKIKAFINSFLILIVIFGCSGCENTSYAPQYTLAAFQKIQIGMSVSEVQRIIGDPFQCYLYSKDVAPLSRSRLYTTIPIDEAQSRSMDASSFVILEYSTKKSPNSDYYYVSLTVEKGKVTSLGRTLITE